jgi:hypothetical protein
MIALSLLFSISIFPQRLQPVTSRQPLLFIFDVENAPIELQTDSGPSESVVSGQFLLRTANEAGKNRVPAEVVSAIIHIDSVPTTRGESGPLTLSFHGQQGRARFFQTTSLNLALHSRLKGEMSYGLIDRTIGEREFDDYTEPFSEGIVGSLSFSGQFDEAASQFAGQLALDFQLTSAQVGAIQAGQLPGVFITLPVEPLAAFATNLWEICIEIIYEEGAQEQWQPDVNEMIDRANEIWLRCGIRVRTKLRDEKCVKVILRKRLARGGGGVCDGAGRGAGSSVEMGRNVVGDCGNQGTTTSYGQILAHELGHSMGLPQQRGGGNLMSDCAPNGTLTDSQCDDARKKAKKISTPEAVAEGVALLGGAQPALENAGFEFKNETRQEATDLHIEFDTAVWVRGIRDRGMFKDIGGEGTTRLDLGRGNVTVAPGTSVGVDVVGVGSKPKCRSCYWTKDNRNIGGCRCPE